MQSPGSKRSQRSEKSEPGWNTRRDAVSQAGELKSGPVSQTKGLVL